MSRWAILATGPSMSQAVADAARAECDRVVAVSNAYLLAPWADALVSADTAWWRVHPDALDFAGEKFSVFEVDERVQRAATGGPIMNGSNSGLLAMSVAVSLGATELRLYGFDLHGSHFFGAHPAPLKNTKPHLFEAFKRQFARYKPKGVSVINCTLGSALTCYKFVDEAVNSDL